jgi:hypothetical protein
MRLDVNRRVSVLIIVAMIGALMPVPGVAGNVTRFSDDMELGTGGWTATGFWNLREQPELIQVLTSGTLDCPPNDISPDLVTLPGADQTGVAHLPAAVSGTHAWWYGVPQNGTFIGSAFPIDGVTQDCKNGGESSAPNGGTLTSPSIDLRGLSSATLRFRTWFEVESVDVNNFDLMTIEVSTDGGPFAAIGRLNPSLDLNGQPDQPFTSGGFTSGPCDAVSCQPPYNPFPAVWVDAVFSLNAYVGHRVMIRFNFNTGDTHYNGFRGWLIDDVAVEGVNDPPVANNDKYAVEKNSPLTVAAPGVLVNDSDPNGSAITAVLVAGPSQAASFSLGANGSFTYTPVANFSGTDSFTYRASDGELTSNIATVTIAVISVNKPPVLTLPVPITVNEATPISFTVSATDPDGPFPLTFSVSNLPAGATLSSSASACSASTPCTAVFSWTPSSAQGGPNPYLVQFTVNDGQLSDTKTVSITVNDTIADRDGDGVPDAVDNCPDDPNPTQVNVCGNSPETTKGTQTATQFDGQIPVTFTATVTADKTDISFLPPTLFTVNCKVINTATGAVVPVERIPEAGPFVLNLADANRPGDLAKVAAKTSASFTTTFDLRIYHPTLPNGIYTTVCTQVQFGQILNPTADDPPLWTGEIQAPPQTIFVGQYQFSGFFSPLPGAKFSQTNTVPMKFALKDSTGAFVTTCTCTLTFQRLNSNGTLIGDPAPAVPTSGSGNQFKYDSKNNQYVFTVASGSLPVGPVQLQVNLHDGSPLRTITIVVTP